MPGPRFNECAFDDGVSLVVGMTLGFVRRLAQWLNPRATVRRPHGRPLESPDPTIGHRDRLWRGDRGVGRRGTNSRRDHEASPERVHARPHRTAVHLRGTAPAVTAVSRRASEGA